MAAGAGVEGDGLAVGGPMRACGESGMQRRKLALLFAVDVADPDLQSCAAAVGVECQLAAVGGILGKDIADGGCDERLGAKGFGGEIDPPDVGIAVDDGESDAIAATCYVEQTFRIEPGNTLESGRTVSRHANRPVKAISESMRD